MSFENMLSKVGSRMIPFLKNHNLNTVQSIDQRFLTVDRTFKVHSALKILVVDYQSPKSRAAQRASRTSRLNRAFTSPLRLWCVDPDGQADLWSFYQSNARLHFRPHIGLITFSTKPMVRQAIADVIEDFRTSVHNISCEGFTSLWDALALAFEQLSGHGQKFPGARKRIICLSDGEDTTSSRPVQEVCLLLQVSRFNWERANK